MPELQEMFLESAGNVAAGLTEARLRSNTMEKLVQFVVDECLPERLKVDFAGKKISYEQVDLPTHSPLEAAGIAMPSHRPAVVPGLQIDLHFAYAGRPHLLNVTPNIRGANPPHASVYDNRLVITFTPDGGEDPEFAELARERGIPLSEVYRLRDWRTEPADSATASTPPMSDTATPATKPDEEIIGFSIILVFDRSQTDGADNEAPASDSGQLLVDSLTDQLTRHGYRTVQDGPGATPRVSNIDHEAHAVAVV